MSSEEIIGAVKSGVYSSDERVGILNPINSTTKNQTYGYVLTRFKAITREIDNHSWQKKQNNNNPNYFFMFRDKRSAEYISEYYE